jgi:ABC-2 type transport system ATP-binding protein
MLALEIEGLTRRFGAVTANDDVSMVVPAGDVVGLLGHNGAGKTTLVSQIVGLLRPDSGSIRVTGVDAVAHPAAARRRVALQGQSQAPLDGLTPRTAIELAARIRGAGARRARRAAETLADRLDIGPWLDRRALPDGRGLSGGIRRLTAFGMAIAEPTPLVVLDEPTNDVDPARRRRVWELVRERADGGAGVLLVTHNIAEVERILDRVIVLDRGSVIAAGAPEALRGGHLDDLRMELLLAPGAPDPTDGMQDHIPFGRRVVSGRRTLLAVRDEDAAAAAAWATRLRLDGLIEGFVLTPATLEDAYLALTSSDPTPSLEELTDV